MQILSETMDGVLLAPIFHKETRAFIKELEIKDIPYVFVDSDMSGANPICTISQNAYQSGILAAKLIDYGLREPGEILVVNFLLYSGNVIHAEERSKGFEDYIKDHSTDNRVLHHLMVTNPFFEKLSELLDEKLKHHPAIQGIFINISRAYLIARYLSERNLSHLRLIGYDLIDKNIPYLKSGAIDFILSDNLENQGKLGLAALFNKIVRKSEYPNKIEMPVYIITNQNMNGAFYPSPSSSMNLINE